MAEPMLRETVSRGSSEALGREGMHVSRSAAEDMLESLQARWEELKERLSDPNAAGPTFMRELREDLDYVRVRARYYHQHRPLTVLGAVAATGFVLGLLLGFRRR